MGENSVSSRPPDGRRQRRLKNLLLDRRFQLKYTGYLVAIALILSMSLGLILFRTNSQLVVLSEKSVSQGEKIVSLGHEVVEESRKVSAVVRMNIIRDPIYREDPDLLEAFNSDASEQDRRLDSQNSKLEQQRAALRGQSNALRSFQDTLLRTLTGVLSLLVIAIGLVGIIVTHKIAGPIYKMQRHIQKVAKGDLEVPWGLRKGDELVDFFESFRHMVRSLRTEREQDLAVLTRAIEDLERSGAPSPQLAELIELRDRLTATLNSPSAASV